jgi:hypothetical protein
MIEVKDLPVTRFVNRPPELVRSALMPRAMFMEVVEDLLDEYKDRRRLEPKVIEELRETARSMPRFPLNTWISRSRGCGCVIGEYLIAQKEIGELARQAWVEEVAGRPTTGWGGDTGEDTIGTGTVDRLLGYREDGPELVEFGTQIDSRLRHRLSLEEIGDRVYDSIELVD